MTFHLHRPHSRRHTKRSTILLFNFMVCLQPFILLGHFVLSLAINVESKNLILRSQRTAHTHTCARAPEWTKRTELSYLISRVPIFVKTKQTTGGADKQIHKHKYSSISFSTVHVTDNARIGRINSKRQRSRHGNLVYRIWTCRYKKLRLGAMKRIQCKKSFGLLSFSFEEKVYSIKSRKCPNSFLEVAQN